VFVGEATDGGLKGVPVVISCWKLTQEEVQTLISTGRIWLTVVGKSMPPVSVSVHSPFVVG
jgi:hypothetical protein